ncbi:CatB-related O-acetyltransferase [Methylobacterium sp. WL7]|uniref:CatB-related O-acetyltransferase n=1 Tax=Methylobacterium sp. WL7 TaxID=2603900 RepID=UPI0011C8ADBA|nr:CatB-related O-acetyltransferase [Methylobacterium sp. WL7]TXN42681.1 CatB-related O-acetyltransferase [Methylobacterium sp. WL7]
MIDLTKNVLDWGVKELGWEIGDYTYGWPDVQTWGEGFKLKMGRYCSIGPAVKILLGGDHRTDWISTYPFNVIYPDFNWIKGHPHSRGNVSIGNDVWLGANCTILSGVSIGDGAVIGAHAVISKDVPPYAIAVGNPAQTIRRRFSDEQIGRLLELRWWNYEYQELRNLIPLLQSDQVDEFIRRALAELPRNT